MISKKRISIKLKNVKEKIKEKKKILNESLVTLKNKNKYKNK